MSSALSNVSISLPLYSSNKPNNPYHSPFIKLDCFKHKNTIRAMAAVENRGNLDQLQRATKHDSENSASDDGNNGKGNGRSICILERLAIVSSPENGGARRRRLWETKEREWDYKMRFNMPRMTKDDVEVWVE
ncbi:hypothetical protein GQ457_01G032110 [Hibiscus cannabinus]